MAKPVRIPTPEEFASYDGAHTRVKWRALADNWRCPGCNRTSFEILRWTIRDRGKPTQHEGWIAPLHGHHDHGWPGRFSEEIVCDQCNVADGTAKRQLGLPRDFSFSPSEIAQFVTATPHGRHVLDLEIAQSIYDRWHHGD